MSRDKPHNKKSPEGPQQSKRSKPEYPWVSGSSDVNGRHKIIHADPSKPDQSFIEEFHHDGSFSIRETLKDEKGLKNELFHHERKYGQTKSTHVDGNLDIRAYNKSVVTDKDLGHQVGGDYHKGIGGYEVTGTSKGVKQRHGSQHSKQNHFKSTSGDVSHLNEGNFYTFVEKDYAETFGGSKYSISAKGDIGTHVQDGNYDTFVKKKLRLASNGAMAYVTSDTFSAAADDDMSLSTEKEFSASSKKAMSLSTDDSATFSTKKGMTLQCDQKITIKVGNSKVEIGPEGIKITGAKIDFIKAT